MPALYVPGKPNPYFPKHKYHCIPIDRNIKPIQECKIRHYVGPTADVANGITLSAQCRAKDGFTLPFSRDKYAKLWIVEQRMKFVLRAADQFNKLLNSPQRPRVEESIRAIAAGGGVQ